MLYSAREAGSEEEKVLSALECCLCCRGHWHRSPQLHSQKGQQRVTGQPQVQERGKRTEAQPNGPRERRAERKKGRARVGNRFTATACGFGTQYCCSSES